MHRGGCLQCSFREQHYAIFFADFIDEIGCLVCILVGNAVVYGGICVRII